MKFLLRHARDFFYILSNFGTVIMFVVVALPIFSFMFPKYSFDVSWLETFFIPQPKFEVKSYPPDRPEGLTREVEFNRVKNLVEKNLDVPVPGEVASETFFDVAEDYWKAAFGTKKEKSETYINKVMRKLLSEGSAKDIQPNKIVIPPAEALGIVTILFIAGSIDVIVFILFLLSFSVCILYRIFASDSYGDRLHKHERFMKGRLVKFDKLLGITALVVTVYYWDRILYALNDAGDSTWRYSFSNKETIYVFCAGYIFLVFVTFLLYHFNKPKGESV